MESSVLDPFGDYQVNGYLQNFFKEKDLAKIARLEAASFQAQLQPTIRFLRRRPTIDYQVVLQTHSSLFGSLYPWAGHDRSENAPNIAIVKAGYNTLFAHPADIIRATSYALQRAEDTADLSAHPGEIFGYLAHAHPFLEGNGRTILTVFAELCRRADFHIEWEAIDKATFLRILTEELLRPASALDPLLLRYTRPGVLSVTRQAGKLQVKFS